MPRSPRPVCRRVRQPLPVTRSTNRLRGSQLRSRVMEPANCLMEAARLLQPSSNLSRGWNEIVPTTVALENEWRRLNREMRQVADSVENVIS